MFPRFQAFSHCLSSYNTEAWPRKIVVIMYFAFKTYATISWGWGSLLSSLIPTPGNLPPKTKKCKCPAVARGGGGGMGAAGIDWCISSMLLVGSLMIILFRPKRLTVLSSKLTKLYVIAIAQTRHCYFTLSLRVFSNLVNISMIDTILLISWK